MWMMFRQPFLIAHILVLSDDAGCVEKAGVKEEIALLPDCGIA